MEGPDAPPALDATRYERLLPYAVALDVEDAWTSKFTLAVGAAAVAVAAKGITWYQGPGTTAWGSLATATGNRVTSTTPPPPTTPASLPVGGGGEGKGVGSGKGGREWLETQGGR